MQEIPTVKTFAIEFIRYYARANNKPSEVLAKESLLRHHLLPELGELRLDQVDLRTIERFKADKVPVLSPKSINNNLTVLSRMLNVAHAWGMTPQPPPKFLWMKVPPQEFDFLSFDEARELARGADGIWRTAVRFALRTGLRRGELIALRWPDLDLERRKVMVRRNFVLGVVGTPKNGKWREIPLSEATCIELEQLPKLGATVFAGDDGRMFNSGELTAPIRRAYKASGLRPIGWHVLRHTFASHLVMRGVALKVVQELLGHSNMDMTLRYAHLAPTMHSNAVALLDA